MVLDTVDKKRLIVFSILVLFCGLLVPGLEVLDPDCESNGFLYIDYLHPDNSGVHIRKKEMVFWNGANEWVNGSSAKPQATFHYLRISFSLHH